MKLRYVKIYAVYDSRTGLYGPMKACLNKIYYCLATDNYQEILVYNDIKEWQKCPIDAFAPVQHDPLFVWEE